MDIQSPVEGLDPIRGQIKKKDDGRLEAPENIIKTRSAAYALYANVRTNSLKRFALWAAIEGLIAGNPPYDQEDLDKHGLSHMTNYNDLSASSRFEKECLAYFNLMHQAEVLVQIMLDTQDEEGNEDPDGAKWAQIMSINFDKMLKGWRNFKTLQGTHAAQLVKFGESVLLWPDEKNWKPRVTEINRFLVPDKTLCDFDQLTYCFFENDFTAQYLFEVYNALKDKADKTEPYKYFWNVECLADLLMYRANHFAKANNLSWQNFMDVQVAIQNGDYTYDQVFTDGIRLITLFYKEYDGKITHYMFDPVWNVRTDFLYMADRQYYDFSQACSIFTVSPSHFTLHSNRGVGHKVFSPCQAKNQLACSMVDMGRYSATPMLRNNSGSIKDPQQIRMFPGVPTDIGSAEFVQNNLGNNLPQVMGVVQFLEANLSANLGVSGDDPQFPDASNASLSPIQQRAESYREFSILGDRVSWYYDQWDFVYQNMLAIALRSKKGDPGYEEVRLFKERCIRQGVPEEMFDVKGVKWGLPDHISIRASRVGGGGSTLGLLLGLELIAQTIGGDLNPRAGKEYKRDVIMAALGPDQIARYTQGDNDPDEISGGASLAGTENAIMEQGFSPIFSPSNEHKTHFAVHMAANIQKVQQVQQQQLQPIDAQKFFDHSIQHTAEHWAAIQKSRFGRVFIEKWKKPWDEVQKYAVLNRKNAIKQYEAKIRKEQEDQQATQGVMAEQQRKDFVAEREQDRKDQETERKAKRQDKESETRANLKEREVDEKASLARQKLSLDHQNNLIKTQNENSLEQNRAELEALTEIETP